MSVEPRDEGPGAESPAEAAVPAGGGLSAGLFMSWSEDVPLDDVLAAARRQLRQRAGEDIPAWGEPDDHGSKRAKPDRGRGQGLGRAGEAPDLRDVQGPDVEDPFGDDELLAAELAASNATPPGTPGPVPTGTRPPEVRPPEVRPPEVLPVEALAGHARLTPGPVLAGWLNEASPDGLDDAALVNSVTGWRKVTSWAQAQELAAIAELGRRRGVTCEAPPKRTRTEELAADFAPNEVALALTLTPCAADYWMSLAVSVATRLPRTLAALRSGRIDLGRARLIDQFTTQLDADLARKVEDRVLGKAEEQTTGQLRASLQRAVISVNPEAADRRRKEAERNARVELTGEPEGTASLFGRYLPAAQAAAAWARVSAIAKALETDGATGGIDSLRAKVFIRLLLGAPLVSPGAPEPPDEVSPGPSGLGSPDHPDGPGSGPAPQGDAAGDTAGPGTHEPGSADRGDRPEGSAETSGSGEIPAGGPGPGCCWPAIPSLGELPGLGPGALDDQAMSELLRGRPKLSVPWRTLAGLSAEPGQLGRIGPVVAAVARDLAEAAVADQTCEWRIIVVGARGQPLAVTRIRSPGRAGPSSAEPLAPGPLSQVIVLVPAVLLQAGLLQAGLVPAGPWLAGRASGPAAPSGPGRARLPLALRRILAAAAACNPGDSADGACTHVHSVPGYRVPPRLRAFVEARDQVCGFPPCRRTAASCDMDHTIPYHLGGRTCGCNLGPRCRRHHRMKGLGTWRLEMPRPGELRWISPAGLIYTTSSEPLVA